MYVSGGHRAEQPPHAFSWKSAWHWSLGLSVFCHVTDWFGENMHALMALILLIFPILNPTYISITPNDSIFHSFI